MKRQPISPVDEINKLIQRKPLAALSEGILRTANSRWVRLAVAPWTKDHIPIFMLHRVADPARGVTGLCPNILRRSLSYLSNAGYRFISLEDVFRRLNGHHDELANCVAFTLDDGYIDQAEIAAPIFAEFRCPITIFLITGFIDGTLWPWDEHIGYIFSQTTKHVIEVQIERETILYPTGTLGEREFARRDFRARCKRLPEDRLLTAVKQLSKEAIVTIPECPPRSSRPLTWDIARRLENQGVRFAPHTVSHRIISKMSKDRAKVEISNSWDRIREELRFPLPILAWPNGALSDYGARDMRLLSELNLDGGVSSVQDIAVTQPHDIDPFSGYQVPRLSLPNDIGSLITTVSWIGLIRWTISRQGYIDRFGGRKPFLKFFAYILANDLGLFRNYKKISWSRVERIVFVCFGNICRSPYAETKARSCGISAVSAGTRVSKSKPAHPGAARNAERRGIYLDSHDSKQISEIGIQENDLVLCMEPQHLLAVRDYVRKRGAQIGLLGLFGGKPRPYIPDPYNANDQYFGRCFGWIDEAVEAIARKWSVTEFTDSASGKFAD